MAWFVRAFVLFPSRGNSSCLGQGRWEEAEERVLQAEWVACAKALRKEGGQRTLEVLKEDQRCRSRSRGSGWALGGSRQVPPGLGTSVFIFMICDVSQHHDHQLCIRAFMPYMFLHSVQFYPCRDSFCLASNSEWSQGLDAEKLIMATIMTKSMSLAIRAVIK